MRQRQEKAAWPCQLQQRQTEDIGLSCGSHPPKTDFFSGSKNGLDRIVMSPKQPRGSTREDIVSIGPGTTKPNPKTDSARVLKHAEVANSSPRLRFAVAPGGLCHKTGFCFAVAEKHTSDIASSEPSTARSTKRLIPSSFAVAPTENSLQKSENPASILRTSAVANPATSMVSDSAYQRY